MKGGKRPLGYTIVEVMIVLAITGVMFLIAANFVNGKQERASFTQGSNDLVSKIQAVIEDVTDGHYSDIPLECSSSGSLPVTFGHAVGNATNQGAIPDCVFLGKIIHFYRDSTSLPENYELISLADARATTTVSGSLPDNTVAAVPDLTATGLNPQRLDIEHMRVIADTNYDDNVYNIGFTQGLGAVDASHTYQSGTQAVSLIFAKSPLNDSKADPANLPKGSDVQLAKAAIICVTDGTQHAKLFIGGADSTGTNGNQLAVRIQQLGKAACTLT